MALAATEQAEPDTAQVQDMAQVQDTAKVLVLVLVTAQAALVTEQVLDMALAATAQALDTERVATALVLVFPVFRALMAELTVSAALDMAPVQDMAKQATVQVTALTALAEQQHSALVRHTGQGLAETLSPANMVTAKSFQAASKQYKARLFM